MTRPAFRQSWLWIVAACVVVSAAVGFGIRQDQVSGQDHAATTSTHTLSADTPARTPDQLKHDPTVEHANSLSQAFREAAKTAMPSVVTVHLTKPPKR